MRRVTGSVLPAGLSSSDRIPDATTVHLSAGDIVLLISDGFADSSDDAWLETLFSQWEGSDIHSLTSALMDESLRHGGRSDDASLLVLRLSPAPQHPVQAV